MHGIFKHVFALFVVQPFVMLRRKLMDVANSEV